jgi:nicotinate-nucleotide adenylyltransferase
METTPRQVASAETPIDSPITPWPAPAGASVLLFGGTFDPPHLAHTELALAARDELLGEQGWLVYVPAARNPHKSTQPVAADAHRVEMLRLATKDADRVAVWTDEVDRAAHPGSNDERSFWVDTVTRARAAAGPGAALRFLIGADQAIAFHRWHEHERILEFAEPAVMLRKPCPTRESFRATLMLTGIDPAAWIPRLVSVDAVDAASTDAREAIERGHPRADLLDPLVLGYIERHGLYAE